MIELIFGFQLSQDHITLMNSELRCGHDASALAQDIAAVLLIEKDDANDNKEKEFLMDVEMR
jgi:hypothetical protein